MSAKEIIEEIKKLPEAERAEVAKWIFADDESFFAWADSLPRQVEMTEEEILALPRMIAKNARPPR